MTHSDDYKRGLVDMLEALTLTEKDTGRISQRWRENADLRSIDNTFIIDALAYRKECDERQKLDKMIETLRAAGYAVHNPAHVPSIKSAVAFLEHAGYKVIEPPPAEPITGRDGKVLHDPAKPMTEDQFRSGGGSPMGSYD